MSTTFLAGSETGLLEWLERSKREWVATFDAILDLIVIRASDGRVVRINRAFSDMLQAEPRELVGQRIDGVDAPHDSVLEDPEIRVSGREALRVGGCYLVSRSPILGRDGDVDSEVIVLRDITLRQKMEASLRENEKAASIQALAGGAAHEISNPMVIISGRATLLLSDKDLPARIRTAIEIIHRQATRVMDLTRTLKDLSSPRTDVRTPCDIESVIDEVLAFMAYEFSKQRIRLERNRTDQLPAQIHRGQIIQVLINLFTNARDAMTGGGTLSISTARMEDGDSYQAVISVRDSGSGIPADVLPHIFKPFYTTKPEGKGTGLGLHVCRNIIEQHGGSIRVECGVGTTFSISLPGL